MKTITLDDIHKASQFLFPKLVKTPLTFSKGFSKWAGTNVYFKYENQQLTGSFKVRGAFNKLASLNEEQKKRGVIASSAGNHAQGVAYSARLLGVKAKIVMPKASSIVKIQSSEGYGAEVILHGDFYDEAFSHAKQLCQSEKLEFIPPFEDPFIMAGQGTIGLEILDQLEDCDTIVCSIGGGGLISGIATAAKALKPDIKIFGVVAQNTSAMSERYHNRPLKPKYKSTIADGIALKNPSDYMLETYIRPLVDEVVEVSEAEIAKSLMLLLERTKTLVEGSGAAAVAGLDHLRGRLGQKVAVVLSGGNIDLNLVSTVINRGLGESGRLAQFSVIVEDRPGNLLEVVRIVAQQDANILDVKHDRVSLEVGIRQARIDLLVETRNFQHIKNIEQALKDFGALLN